MLQSMLHTAVGHSLLQQWHDTPLALLSEPTSEAAREHCALLLLIAKKLDEMVNRKMSRRVE